MTDVYTPPLPALAEVVELLARAREVQWSAPPRTTPPAERSAPGGHGDPTADIAIDGQRLRLRTDVIAAERALATLGASLEAIRRHLVASLQPFEQG